MWGQNNFKLKYTSTPSSNKSTNRAKHYAKNLFRSQIDMCNGSLIEDYKKVLDGGCYYLPNFFEKTDEREIFNKLKYELANNKECNMVSWSKHFKFENPDFLSTFNDIVKKMAEHFNVEVCQTRLNYYPNRHSYKPMHHDRHKYGDKREDFTMGASFGGTRALEFKHVKSGNQFKFTQNNGDVFSFDTEINQKFMHGVPKTFKKTGSRFSIIAWGVQLNK